MDDAVDEDVVALAVEPVLDLDYPEEQGVQLLDLVEGSQGAQELMLQADVPRPQHVPHVEVYQVYLAQVLPLGLALRRARPIGPIVLLNLLPSRQGHRQERVYQPVEIPESQLVQDFLHFACENAHVCILFQVHSLHLLDSQKSLQLHVFLL